jgi:hypothetical protein
VIDQAWLPITTASSDPSLSFVDACAVAAVCQLGGAAHGRANRLGLASDTSSGPTTVTTDGQMPMTQDAKYSKSSGDEAGSATGVISSKVMGVCEYMLYSFDVKFEGKNVCRLGDPLFHNAKNGMG